MKNKSSLTKRHSIRLYLFTVVASCMPAAALLANTATNDSLVQGYIKAKDDWRATIRTVPAPGAGCYTANYPDLSWTPVKCVKATPHVPTTNQPASTGNLSSHAAPTMLLQQAVPITHAASSQASTATPVGNGHDYFINTAGVITQAVGSFPSVSGVRTETGAEGVNSYTLQLNTNGSHANSMNPLTLCGSYPNCFTWEQFMVSSDYIGLPSNASPTGETKVFVQQWLEDYGDATHDCPTGWYDYGTYDGGPAHRCVMNSGATVVNKSSIPVTDLASLQLTGNVDAQGNDSAVVTYDDKSYSASISDSNTEIANVWFIAEFNVLGNYTGSEATFNTGATVEVNLAISGTGFTAMPICQLGLSTSHTLETNNLSNLSACTVGGTTTNPYIDYTESI